MKSFYLGISLLVFILAGSACSSTQSAKARPLKPVYGEGVDLSRFQVATIQPFQSANGEPADVEAGRTLANAIARRLEYDFGNLFQDVRVGEPLGQPNEVVVTGRITEYQPGSRWARLMGPGIGKAEIKGELVVKDASSERPILIAPIDKLWAWGHSAGAAKGIEDMMEESAAAAANMIARAKGWEPPAQASVHR